MLNCWLDPIGLKEVEKVLQGAHRDDFLGSEDSVGTTGPGAAGCCNHELVEGPLELIYNS